MPSRGRLPKQPVTSSVVHIDESLTLRVTSLPQLDSTEQCVVLLTAAEIESETCSLAGWYAPQAKVVLYVWILPCGI